MQGKALGHACIWTASVCERVFECACCMCVCMYEDVRVRLCIVCVYECVCFVCVYDCVVCVCVYECVSVCIVCVCCVYCVCVYEYVSVCMSVCVLCVHV